MISPEPQECSLSSIYRRLLYTKPAVFVVQLQPPEIHQKLQLLYLTFGTDVDKLQLCRMLSAMRFLMTSYFFLSCMLNYRFKWSIKGKVKGMLTSISWNQKGNKNKVFWSYDTAQHRGLPGLQPRQALPAEHYLLFEVDDTNDYRNGGTLFFLLSPFSDKISQRCFTVKILHLWSRSDESRDTLRKHQKH